MGDDRSQDNLSTINSQLEDSESKGGSYLRMPSKVRRGRKSRNKGNKENGACKILSATSSVHRTAHNSQTKKAYQTHQNSKSKISC